MLRIITRQVHARTLALLRKYRRDRRFPGFRGFRFPAGSCKVLTPFSADGEASW